MHDITTTSVKIDIALTTLIKSLYLRTQHILSHFKQVDN